MSHTILIVDDDTALRELLAEFMQGHSFGVTQAGDVPAMRAAMAKARFDLVVLDLMMPGEDGLAALRTMDPHNRPPVIMLSAMGSDTDRIVGLEMGADDYLAKPCNPRELLARVRAVLRRGAGGDDTGEVLHIGEWRLDTGARELLAPGGERVDATAQELRLLEILARAGRRVLAREEIAQRLSGSTYESFDRAIDLAISRLRRKLAAIYDGEVIRTVRGEGYGIAPEVVRV